ncbi:glycosyl transferase family 1, partial [Neisseria meningitidis]|nr:glycosyl transferase family 1 [Neisseria meningitidis]
KPHTLHRQSARVLPPRPIAAKILSPKNKILYPSHGLDAATYPKIPKLFDKLGVYILGNCQHESEKPIPPGFPPDRIVYAHNAPPPPPPRNFLSGKPSKAASCSARCRVWTPSAPCI